MRSLLLFMGLTAALEVVSLPDESARVFDELLAADEWGVSEETFRQRHPESSCEAALTLPWELGPEDDAGFRRSAAAAAPASGSDRDSPPRSLL